MKTLFLILLTSDAIQPCVKCKYFKNDFWTLSKYGKCTLYPKPIEDDAFFVTGVKTPKKIEYSFCSTARMSDSMCGEEGKYYQKVQ
jgi:hypothetical protein